jgi:methionyl-tRNA synthetase
VWAHGWLTVDGQKMSKSLGNFIHPAPIVEAVGADVLRYYLMRDIAFGQDGDFNHNSLFARYHGELGNGLGNLLNRILASIVRKTLEGKVPTIDRRELLPVDRALLDTAQTSAANAARQLELVHPNRALEAIWELVSAANKYVDQTEPWKLVKNNNGPRLAQVVYTSLEALRYLGLMLWPFMPQKSAELLHQLGFDPLTPVEGVDLWPNDWGKLPGGIETRPGKPLFPRFEKDQEAAILAQLAPKPVAPAEPKPSATATTSAATAAASKPAAARELSEKAGTTIDVFGQIDLRVGEVKLAERVPKSDKLLRLEVDLGPLGTRQILAGIGKHYAPEALIGKRIAVLANLPPRKMMGLMSQGMVLAAGDGEILSVLSPANDDVPLGSTIA